MKRAYFSDKNQQGSWSQNVRSICVSCEMLLSWEQNEVVNLCLAEKHLLELYEMIWKREVGAKSKLRINTQIKTTLSTAKHLSANINKHSRCLISQLLSGCLPLEVETGRYTQTPRELRQCRMCKHGREDEEHFLFECPALSRK